jgi:hypothetical protein
LSAGGLKRSMIAVDTNIIVRIATGDNPGEKVAAQALFDNHRILVTKTVLLVGCKLYPAMNFLLSEMACGSVDGASN